MVELDSTVVRVCQQHLAKVNGGILDKMEGDKHKIIIGDALEWMLQAK